MIRRPPRSTQGVSSAASDVYKRQSQDARLNSDSLGSAKDGIPATATSADHTAAPEFGAQSPHEDGRLATTVDQDMPGPPCPVIFLGAALWRMRATTGLASPSEFTPAQQLPEGRNPRVSQPHAMNATHGNPSRALTTPRLHLGTRGYGRHSSAFSLVNAPRQANRIP